MEKDTLRMQFLSGVITEGQYKDKLQENNDKIHYTINKVGNSFRIFALTPKMKSEGSKPEDAETLFSKGTMWKDYSTSSEAQKAIDSLSNNPFDNKRKMDMVGESLNESMIGGIVGIGAINQIPPRAKADYETAFEHFLGGKYGLNEVEIEEAEMPAIDSKIANDPDFQKLVDYFEENPIKAKKVKDKLKTLEEITENQYGVNKSSDGSYFTQDGVYSTYYFKKNDKYYKKQSLPGGYGFGKHKTDEISKEDFQKIQKEYWKDQLMKIGLGAAAVGFVGALMAGPLGANDPGNILQAALIAAGFGGAAASIFEKEEGKEVEELSLYEGEVNENVGFTIDKMLQTFEFSEKGNDEMIEFGNYLLSPEGPKNIARSIKGKLKGEGGENYFTSKPEELDAFLSKLK